MNVCEPVVAKPLTAATTCCYSTEPEHTLEITSAYKETFFAHKSPIPHYVRLASWVHDTIWGSVFSAVVLANLLGGVIASPTIDRQHSRSTSNGDATIVFDWSSVRSFVR